MQEWGLRKKDKFNRFGIFLESKLRNSLPTLRLCQESGITKPTTIILLTSKDTDFLGFKRTRQTYGFHSIMVKFTLCISPRSIHTGKEVNNTHF